MKMSIRSIPVLIVLTLMLSIPSALAAPSILEQRQHLFEQTELLTGIPWYLYAAVDQYDRTMARFQQKSRTHNRNTLLAIHYDDSAWYGLLNIRHAADPTSIALFGGVGKDGNGDGSITTAQDADLLCTLSSEWLKKGTSEKSLRKALLLRYHNDKAVKRIEQFSRMYQHFGTLALQTHTFPLPLSSHYSYRNTWGASRGYGGRRIHEGTDLFAGYGVPVRSTSYGIIEEMGWNRYGGWRIGIRDINNVYHYYAHLSGFNKNQKTGSFVMPGDIIGWVGSSGYGRKGTQGKFPPHLHYGMYRDTGKHEWSFDPYPYLRRWEREAKRKSG